MNTCLTKARGLQKLICLFLVIFSLGIGVLAAPSMTVYANNKKTNKTTDATDAEWIKKGDTNEDIDGVTTTVKETGRSVYILAMAVLAAVCITALVVAAISIAARKAGNAREENKDWLIWICVAIAIGTGAASIYTFFAHVF